MHVSLRRSMPPPPEDGEQALARLRWIRLPVPSKRPAGCSKIGARCERARCTAAPAFLEPSVDRRRAPLICRIDPAPSVARRRYHRIGRKGKLEISATKSVGDAAALSIAYSPGVAEPCVAIKADPSKVCADVGFVAVQYLPCLTYRHEIRT